MELHGGTIKEKRGIDVASIPFIYAQFWRLLPYSGLFHDGS